jgi:hypothetical protein
VATAQGRRQLGGLGEGDTRVWWLHIGRSRTRRMGKSAP